MSANHWAICPKCKLEHDKEIQKLKSRVSNSYGKVSQEDYLLLVESVGTLANKKLETELREDWELGTDDSGDFYIRYSCSCYKCKFSYEFKYDKNILK